VGLDDTLPTDCFDDVLGRSTIGEASVVESFGALLRTCRLAAGISLGELARRINYSKSQVSKIENGIKRPTAMFAKLCDRVLGADGVLAAAAPSQPTRTEATKPGDIWVLGLEESGVFHFAELPHRQILGEAGALLGNSVTRSGPTAVDDHTLAVLRVLFDQYRTLGTMTSPAVVLAPVIAHVHTLRTLAADSSEPMRSDLLLLAARVAEYVGWMSQEAGREAQALLWTDRAVQLAAGRDPQLASFALFRHAEIALCQHNPVRTIELARRAQQDQSVGPRILGLAARCEAQGYALAGDVRGYEQAFERAAALLAVPEHGDGPVLGSASVPDDVALVQGSSLYDLGQPRAAAELLDQQISTIPLDARRARARFGVRRALAHAQNGDIDQACIAVREVLADVAQVDSATIRLDLRELSRTLGRWHTHPAVRDLRQELVTVLYGPG
jgi:transcriptional regulator with XRE-family HTH domain/tetratricopeptide (TPR) repeat protein